MKNKKYYQETAAALIRKDEQRDRDYREYDKMYHNKWDMPGDLASKLWIWKSPATDPHDAVQAGVRALSALDPKITFYPLASNEATKKRANDIERLLGWQLWRSSRRRQASISRDFVKSALLYDEITAQVIDLDYQLKLMEDAESENTNKVKAMRRYSRFMVNSYNPRYVHARYSNMMVEQVLLAQVKTAFEVYKEFGKRASGLKKLAEDTEDIKKVQIYDYWDPIVRAVWAIDTENNDVSNVAGEKPYWIIEPEEHGLDFPIWVCRVGGSTLEYDEEYKRHPLLFSVLKAGQWDTLNVVDTLVVSEAIAKSGQPRIAEEGPIPEQARTTEVDYDDPMRKMDVTPGNVVKQLPPEMIDAKLLDVQQLIRGQMENSTVSKSLQSAPAVANESFSSLNLRTQIATGALLPYKELAEFALEDTLEVMLNWVANGDKPLESYGMDKEGMGTEYIIYPDEINTDELYVKVELVPDTPTDKVGKINAATMAVQALDMSKEMALEEVGIGDPQQVMKQRYFEQLFEHRLEMIKQRDVMQMQMEMQQMQMQMQMQQQQQQMSMQAEQQMMVQQAQGMQGAQGIPGAGGQGFNPAMGGMPPAQMMPEATREQQTGMAMNGLPVENPFGG